MANRSTAKTVVVLVAVLAIVVFWIKQQVDQDWDEDAGIALVH
jgi:hypothetical protein